MYLFLPGENATGRVPGKLLEQLGPLELALQFELTPERSLARAQAPAVMKALEEMGYYLQLPPPKGQ